MAGEHYQGRKGRGSPNNWSEFGGHVAACNEDGEGEMSREKQVTARGGREVNINPDVTPE